MTWGYFKHVVESRGVRNSDEIEVIDIAYGGCMEVTVREGDSNWITDPPGWCRKVRIEDV